MALTYTLFISPQLALIHNISDRSTCKYKSVVYTVHYVTGSWKTVERDVKIPHNLETTPLQIKTDSTAGSKDEVRVFLRTAGGDSAGYVQLYFSSPPEYYLGSCTKDYTDLPSTLPSEVNKVWVITKLPGPRLTVQCNGVTVVDITMSDTCSYGLWGKYWSRKVEQIEFSSYDTASDEYWGLLPGNTLIIFNINCLLSYYYHTVRKCLFQFTVLISTLLPALLFCVLWTENLQK